MTMRRLARSTFVSVLALCLSLFGIDHIATDAAAQSSSLTPPGCDLTSGAVPPVSQLGSPLTQVSGQPYGLALSTDGRNAFVSTNDPATLRSYTLTEKGAVPEGQNWWTTALVPAMGGSPPSGLALTPDDRHLVVAVADGAAVFTVGKKNSSAPSLAFDGILPSTGGQPLEVAVSGDGRFVFLSDHGSGKLVVFNLKRALKLGFGLKDVVGTVMLGTLPGGMSLSPNGRHLYVVSERASVDSTYGTLTTLSVSELEKRPAQSVVSTVDSGCGSVRVVATSSAVYVTARDANSLLSFSASALVDNPRSALLGALNVETGPIGLGLINHHKGLVIADSRGDALAVLAIDRPGGPTLLGYVKSGEYPRELAVSPNGHWVLVSAWDSDQIQVVPSAALLSAWPHL
jgi:DNA-binding beta-propeller fold protein YncE